MHLATPTLGFVLGTSQLGTTMLATGNFDQLSVRASDSLTFSDRATTRRLVNAADVLTVRDIARTATQHPRAMDAIALTDLVVVSLTSRSLTIYVRGPYDIWSVGKPESGTIIETSGPYDIWEVRAR